MKNFIQRGDVITVTAPTGGVTSGQGVLVGNLFGIASFIAYGLLCTVIGYLAPAPPRQAAVEPPESSHAS